MLIVKTRADGKLSQNLYCKNGCRENKKGGYAWMLSLLSFPPSALFSALNIILRFGLNVFPPIL